MHLMLVIGAGASHDCWPNFIETPHGYESKRLPLANALFSHLPIQNDFLNKYSLMGLASPLRYRAKIDGDKFDIEAELAKFNDTAIERKEPNTIQNLFKARFYLHSVISALTDVTLQHTSSHTLYVDLLVKLKDWIDESPKNRYVDIVVFNYDNLIEKAMETVYGYEWNTKTDHVAFSIYYKWRNLRIYKPHGSINWGREVIKEFNHFYYKNVEEAFHDFNKLELANSFQFIDPLLITDNNQSKNVIPAIAVPFKKKTNFDECPQEMQFEMLNAVNRANKLITLGWKGAEEHFTDLLKTNSKIDEVFVVSPRADTYLGSTFSQDKIKPFKSTAMHFVNEALEGFLDGFGNLKT